eukprot:NODE_138_length_16264_cov_1.140860.p1 type:complete len:682 gc:universal NODE_138_length_16264_cov_1.140860:13008-15053(+)
MLIEPVAFEFNGEIQSFAAYNDKLSFLLHNETGHKILRIDLKNPEVIEDFNVTVSDDHLMKLQNNILLLTHNKLNIVDLNLEYDLESKFSDIVEYKDGYIASSQHGHIYFIQGSTVLDSGLMNKLRNKSKPVLKSTEIGSLPDEKLISKMIVEPFADSSTVGFLFIQNRILFQGLWANNQISILEVCRDVIDVAIYRSNVNSPISKVCIATSRSVNLAIPDYKEKIGKWITISESIPLDVVKISHCFLTEYYVGIVDAISKIVSFYWIPENSSKIVEKIWESKILDLYGFYHDTLKNTYWIYTNRQLYEIVSVNETKGLWKKFVEIHNFSEAKKLSTSLEEKDEILYFQGKHLLSKGQGTSAASCFANMSHFDIDGITLLFLEAKSNALKDFLIKAIPRLPNKVSKSLVVHWALFLALEEANEQRLRKVKSNMKEFCLNILSDFKYLLHKKTVYQLLYSHDEDDLLLQYANLISDHKFIFQFYIDKKDFKNAIQTLQQQSDASIIHQNISQLLQNSPKEAIHLLLGHPNIEPKSMIPPFVKHLSLKGESDLPYILDYLEKIVTLNKDQAIHNFLFSLYCQYCNEKDTLIPYLNGNHRFCDMEYALRQAEKFKKHFTIIQIYSEMELHNEALDLALGLEDFELSKLTVNKVPDEAERHRLWLRIARYIVEKKKNLNQYLLIT